MSCFRHMRRRTWRDPSPELESASGTPLKGEEGQPWQELVLGQTFHRSLSGDSEGLLGPRLCQRFSFPSWPASGSHRWG